MKDLVHMAKFVIETEIMNAILYPAIPAEFFSGFIFITSWVVLLTARIPFIRFFKHSSHVYDFPYICSNWNWNLT